MIHSHSFNGVVARSGDVLFTRDGTPNSIFGQLWRAFGHILPGDLDHVALYVGPGVRFVESAANGVVLVDMAGDTWDAERYARERLLLDELVGVANPLAGQGLSEADETRIREGVVAYCLKQVSERKPYNLNFFDPEKEGAFYCSQLVYKAYARFGIELHGIGQADANPLMAPIVLPEDIWNACADKQRVPGIAGSASPVGTPH